MAIKIDRKEKSEYEQITFPCLMTNETYDIVLMLSEDDGIVFEKDVNGNFKTLHEANLDLNDLEMYHGEITLSNK